MRKTTKDGKFTLGEGATYRIYTDCHAGTVIDINPAGDRFTMQFDDAKLITKMEFVPGGFSAHCMNNYAQKYEYTRNTENGTEEFSLRKNGSWKRAKHPMSSPGCEARPGRHQFHDYNF